MQQADSLIRTKLRLPFLRPELVSRPRLQARIVKGLRGPLTLVIAPAGFGKTTLVAAGAVAAGMPVAWLSLDKNDNQAGRFLSYLVAALQEADARIGSGAAQLLAASQQAPPEAVLTSLINDLDATGKEIALVLDDYQLINSQAVHEEVAFLLEYCPKALHLVIASRSDPPLPVARLRGRGQAVEIRAADLRFTESEAAQFLNEVMGLRLEARAVALLEKRTEGWIAGLQMAALSMRDREDVFGFIEGFSGTNRYILDYLLEEVLASQPPAVQHFLLHTSILERLAAPLCEAVLVNGEGSKKDGKERSTSPEAPSAGQPASMLAYLEKANLFLVPLNDERVWYRYHQLFADLLRTQLHRLLGAQGVASLHVRAADWHGEYGSILEAINHASLAADEARVERFIEQNYMELVSRGEQVGLRYWAGKLSKELVYRRPWLCIYEAYSHAWFGELDEADRLLEEAEKRIGDEIAAPEVQSMLGHLAYVKSRVTAMRGDIQRAIEYCLTARQYTPDDNLALQLDTQITLGYEYFLEGDYANASPVLNEMIRSGIAAGAVINTVAAACLLARLAAVQGQLNQAYDTYLMATQSIPEASGQHLGAKALVEIGLAEVYCERNDLAAALAHVKQGLELLPMWDKADDWALAYVILGRIQMAQAKRDEAAEAIEKAARFIQTRGVFCEARMAVEAARVRLWLAQGDLQPAQRWAVSQAESPSSSERFCFRNELADIIQARVLIAQNRLAEAGALLATLEETARSAGRMGRVIEILLLQVLARREMGDTAGALQALGKCLGLAGPQGYTRIFLDEGQPVQRLLIQWLAQASAGPWRDYAAHLLSQFNAEPDMTSTTQEKASPNEALIEPLSQREIEVLQLMALGKTNREIAGQLIVSPGTVKAHTASIYRKLDVSNRTEAAARARKLGILP
ncbi:MAG: LuxR C-terminal-related transcriptional regulator [Chloroflexota bacterium]